MLNYKKDFKIFFNKEINFKRKGRFWKNQIKINNNKEY